MRDGGSIVNVSSIAGLTGHYAVGYTVSKWGVRGLSRVASMDLGERGIRVNAIFPGYIETPMTASAPAAFRAANVRGDALGRVGTSEEVAPLVVFLISDESSFITGAEIVIDGGQVAHGGAMSFQGRGCARRLLTEVAPEPLEDRLEAQDAVQRRACPRELMASRPGSGASRPPCRGVAAS